MNHQQLRQYTMSMLPKYLVDGYTLGKGIRRNNLRQGQKVVAVTKDAKQPFLCVCEILGFASFYDLDGTVSLSEGLIPNSPENKAFYQGVGLPVFKGNDEDPEPVFFHRCKSEPLELDFLTESVRRYEDEMSPIALSDEGFDAHEYCAPILVAKSLRRIQKKYILLQRHSELDQWMTSEFTTISWFELVSNR